MRLVSRVAAIAVVVAVAFGVGIVACRSAWNYAGYCRDQGRLLTKDERIAIAIDYVLQTYPPSIRLPLGSRNLARPEKPIAYFSEANFRAENPNCCEEVSQLPEGEAPGLFAKTMGRFATFVRVKFRVKYRTESGAEEAQLAESYVAITNCGRPWNGI